MNVIDNIIDEIKTELEAIQGQSQIVHGQTYQYQTKTASVNLFDTVKSSIKDLNSNGVAYNIQYGNEQYDYTENNTIQCQLELIIEASIRASVNAGTEISKNKINSMMNDVIADIGYNLYKNHDMSNTTFHIYPQSTEREYTNTSDIINGGKLKINCSLIYYKFGLNPLQLKY